MLAVTRDETLFGPGCVLEGGKRTDEQVVTHSQLGLAPFAWSRGWPRRDDSEGIWVPHKNHHN